MGNHWPRHDLAILAPIAAWLIVAIACTRLARVTRGGTSGKAARDALGVLRCNRTAGLFVGDDRHALAIVIRLAAWLALLRGDLDPRWNTTILVIGLLVILVAGTSRGARRVPSRPYAVAAAMRRPTRPRRTYGCRL